MLSKITSASFYGIDGYLVTVEVDISSGLPVFSTVGLPDRVVSESKERVTVAIRNSGIKCEVRRITVNLAPAGIKKEGAGFDLPIAIGILAARGIIRPEKIPKYVIIGELALDGMLRRVKGILPVSLALRAAASDSGFCGIILPCKNAGEAAVVSGIDVIPVKNLGQAVRFLNGEEEIVPHKSLSALSAVQEYSEHDLDFAEIKGQDFAKRAFEVAAAGSHNIIMIGPPGAGKTMLASRLPTILPPMIFEEALEITKIHSVAGLAISENGLVSRRPFVTPHHTISSAALAGGSSSPKPGEISMAHNGVLFLDELPEFHKDAIEALRQPLEKGEITISRTQNTVKFPANFMLVAALNPCPCGYYGSAEKECICSGFQVQKYLSKISGPLLDRIDIHLEVPSLRVAEIMQDNFSGNEKSAEIRKRVDRARTIQKERFLSCNIYTNSRMTVKMLRRFCIINSESKNMLKNAVEKLGLSARSYDKILKVARTIADLEGVEQIRSTDISEAIQYRCLDRLV